MAQSSSVSSTSSRKHTREHKHSSTEHSSNSQKNESDWDKKQALIMKELEETKARCVQMEKTMRWWSECTSNWKKKWEDVRDERNQFKRELKAVRINLEYATKDSKLYKEECQELLAQNSILKKEVARLQRLMNDSGHFENSVIETNSQIKNIVLHSELMPTYSNGDGSGKITPTSLKKEGDNCKSPKSSTDGRDFIDKDIEDYISQGAVPKRVIDTSSKENSLTDSEKRMLRLGPNDESLLQKISVLTTKLDEAGLTITEEKEEKEILLRKVEKLNSEIKKLKKACEELKESRTDVMRELLEIKSENFRGELQSDLADETINKEGQNSRLAELRLELERLQAENAAEWGERERLETEKILLERENKQLRNELREIKERPLDSPLSSSRKSTRPKSGCLDSPESTKQLQVELLETNRELSDLKQSVAKLKKLLAEKTTELSHSTRRSEQYEVEVKRIRKRVDELKKELTTALEEVDAANLTIRRLKRTNENLQDELDDTREKLDEVRRIHNENRAPDVVAEIIDEEKCRECTDDERKDLEKVDVGSGEDD
ncbi:coiled-coil domain-containing protein 102A [Trichogramma pretiosum]|uniref:coiled-coil domain-containing protein 102A n=1 Tax=Trichogramma pretiosum TaxID=7493 RepID=UPI0006C9AD10|nr:coiled-coil domain-containing protein 102A [Trichogramma pretiosum]XP_014233666.1 coiled-coil domain-containing protein 102A [Trichogramma pretiosum]